MKIANQFVCKSCGNIKAISPSADLDFESCSVCDSMGEWGRPKPTASAEVLPRSQVELLPANIVKMSAKELFADKQIKDVVIWAKEKAAKHTPDTSTDKGRKAIASNSARVSSTKVILEKIAAARKAEIKKDSEAEVEIISTGLKYMISELETLRDDSRKPLTEWEVEDEARKAAEALAEEISSDHDAALAEDDLFNRERAIARDKAKLSEEKEKRQAKKAEEKRLEEEKAAGVKEEAERKKREEKIQADANIKAEKEDEIKREKADKEIADAKAATEKANREKKEAAKKAIQDKRDAEKKAKQDRIAAEKRAAEDKRLAVEEAKRKAKEEAEQKERDRLAKEKSEQEAADLAAKKAEKKAAAKGHRIKIHKGIVKDIIASTSITEAQANEFISMQVSGKIKKVTIDY